MSLQSLDSHPKQRCAMQADAEKDRARAAHTVSDSGMSMKASDYSCVPLCAFCHRTGRDAYHSADGKRKIEARMGCEFAEIAAELCAAFGKMQEAY